MSTTEDHVRALDDEAERLEAEQDAREHELDHDLENDPPEGHLIDPAIYESEELALPRVDGEQVDKIHAKFTGRTWLDRADPRDCALVRELRMGQSVTLMVEAIVGPPTPGFATDREGSLDVITLGRTFNVQRVWRASPESVSRAIADTDRELAETELGTAGEAA